MKKFIQNKFKKHLMKKHSKILLDRNALIFGNLQFPRAMILVTVMAAANCETTETKLLAVLGLFENPKWRVLDQETPKLRHAKTFKTPKQTVEFSFFLAKKNKPAGLQTNKKVKSSATEMSSFRLKCIESFGSPPGPSQPKRKRRDDAKATSAADGGLPPPDPLRSTIPWEEGIRKENRSRPSLLKSKQNCQTN